MATVLIVEDERPIADLIKARLDEEGFKTSVAYTAKDAVQKLKKKNPDFITLDIYLPDGNGLEILKELKADPDTDKIPVVIISSSDEEESALKCGAIKFVKKPIDFKKLFAMLDKMDVKTKKKGK